MPLFLIYLTRFSLWESFRSGTERGLNSIRSTGEPGAEKKSDSLYSFPGPLCALYIFLNGSSAPYMTFQTTNAFFWISIIQCTMRRALKFPRLSSKHSRLSLRLSRLSSTLIMPSNRLYCVPRLSPTLSRLSPGLARLCTSLSRLSTNLSRHSP